MKAEVVHNTKGEPRVLLRFEDDDERALFESGPVLRPCVRGDEVLREPDEDDVWDDGESRLAYYSFTLDTGGSE